MWYYYGKKAFEQPFCRYKSVLIISVSLWDKKTASKRRLFFTLVVKTLGSVNRIRRTNWSTKTALSTFISVDYTLVTFFRNRTNRAFWLADSAVRTIIIDGIRHLISSEFFEVLPNILRNNLCVNLKIWKVILHDNYTHFDLVRLSISTILKHCSPSTRHLTYQNWSINTLPTKILQSSWQNNSPLASKRPWQDLN